MLFRVMLVVVLAALSACGDLNYGQSAPYHPRYQEPLDIYVPPNAPSITQQFRPRKITFDDGETSDSHLGMDVHAPIGTPILAAASGVVIRSLFEPAYGHQIVVLHGDYENGKQITSHYMHLASRSVTRGARVARGSQIGEMGATGVLAGGFAHLHFEIRMRDSDGSVRAHDPHVFWVNGAGRVSCFDNPPQADITRRFVTTYPVACRPS